MANSQKSADGVRPGELSGIITKLWASIEVRIPFGYQNETGFHYGMEPISSFLERLSESPPSIFKAGNCL
jgi:hypothetical protein